MGRSTRRRAAKLRKVFEDDDSIYVRALLAREGDKLQAILQIKNDDAKQNMAMAILCGCDKDGRPLWASEDDVDLLLPDLIYLAQEAGRINGVWADPDDEVKN